MSNIFQKIEDCRGVGVVKRGRNISLVNFCLSDLELLLHTTNALGFKLVFTRPSNLVTTTKQLC